MLFYSAARSDEHKAQLFLVFAAFEIIRIKKKVHTVTKIHRAFLYTSLRRVSTNTSFIVFNTAFVYDYYFQ